MKCTITTFLACMLLTLTGCAPDPVEYHSSVANWTITADGSSTRWERGYIQYVDNDGDGIIDGRGEQRDDRFIYSEDTDSDGIFDKEWDQQYSGSFANQRLIHERVPATGVR